METKIESIPAGTITSPAGFRAGAVYAGIKKKAENALDLAILHSTKPCVAAGVFTTNRIKAAPVVLSQERLRSGKAAAVVANSGCANACTGEPGFKDAEEMARLAAERLGVPPELVVVASTGVIGQRLPMPLIRAGIKEITLTGDGGHKFTRAIMTTDTVPKEIAVSATVGDTRFTIGGVAKGAGMIHPNMATMLSFLTTDAAIELDFLKSALKKAAALSFNMVSVDGDTSTNDTLLIMANGLAGNRPIRHRSALAGIFQQVLNQVCTYLAKAVARDGEGATRLIEVTITGALTAAQARQAARTVVTSPLVKSAVHGNDPNWGRIVAAVGRSGIPVVEDKLDVYIGDICLLKAGQPLDFDEAEVIRTLKSPEVPVKVELNLGKGAATAWGCDLSEEYVTINSQYTT
ncbi:MAG: bifunctional glutamate N-acetyltransferase/amino-acid acetyltransferase ArgJ [Chloroflexota bacterium]|nr:bifunctional glutamate N-acetyltransferase/amino-acid acetyltransferase ArgJ [Chloroflexota bacterium]